MRYCRIRSFLLVVGLLVASTASARAQETSTPGAKPTAYTGALISLTLMGLSADTTVPPLMSYPEVRLVIKHSPADSAGIAVGDVIVEINGQDPRHQRPIPIVVPTLGEKYVLRVRRGEAEREVTLVAVPRPADLPPDRELMRMQREAPRSGT
jgi:C-terminal processing protease CtpA/Prc